MGRDNDNLVVVDDDDDEEENIARILNAVQCHSELSCHRLNLGYHCQHSPKCSKNSKFTTKI